MSTKIHYEDSAYNSNKITLQPPKSSSSFLHKLITKGQQFGYAIPNSQLPLSFIQELTPSEYQEDSMDSNKRSFWDDEKLISESFSPLSQIYFFLIGLTKVSLIFMIPLFYIVVIISMLNDSEGMSEYLDIMIGTAKYLVLPFLLLQFHFKLIGMGHFYLAPFLKCRINYTLNRKTGMVTLYKKGNKVRFSHPFIEFDCVLMSAPSPQGHLNYSLMLVHRYHEYSTGVPLHNFVGSNQLVSEYALVWNMIQRYMDTSQPMPDVLALEQSRDKDPVTAAHDKKTNRPPRYWRDMTDEQFEKTISKMREQQKNSPSTGPTINIFAEDPSCT